MTINEKILSELRFRSPLLMNSPKDLYYYSNGCNKAQLNQGFPGTGTHKFLNDPEKDRSKKPYKDFSYYINDIGFRDNYPDVNDNNVMGFFGCSCTFGEGLASEDTFVHHTSKYFGTSSLNLGMPGSSASRISLIFSSAIRIWKIKTAIITLPNWGRFLYYNSNNEIHNIVPPHPTRPKENEEVRLSLVKNFSDQYLMFAFMNAVIFMIETAKSNNVNLIFGCWEAESREIVHKVIEYWPTNFHLFPPDSEPARDQVHPGIEANLLYSNDIIKRIESNDYVKTR